MESCYLKQMNRAVLLTVVLLIAGAVLSARYLLTDEGEQLHFSATGYVESLTQRGQTCELRVAIYDWVSLSPDFPVTDVPQQNDRYILRARGDTCTAATVATASAEGHILFSAARRGRNWQFAAPPTAAVACGGLESAWVPGPVRTLR
jgi:hypothetical protein